MKISIYGIIIALKNIGIYLGTTYPLWSSVQIDPYQFAWAFGIFLITTIPSDLYVLNHATTKSESDAKSKKKV